MQVYAFALWCAYAGMVVGVGWLGLAQGRLSLIAFAVVLLLTTVLRQPLYFLGLDGPHPAEFFNATEWDLICTANLALIGWVGSVMLSYGLGAMPGRVIGGIFPSRCLDNHEGIVPRGVFLTVLAPFAFSVFGTLFLIAESGGLARFMYDVKVGKDLAGLYIIRSAASLASMLAFYGVLASLRRTPGGGLRLSPMAWVYLLMVVTAMSMTFAWGNRGAIMLIALGYLTGFHLFIRPLRVVEVLTLGLLLAAGLQGLKILRLALVSEAVGRELGGGNEDFWLNLSLSLHLVELDAFMLALRDAGSLFEFRWGQDFLNGLVSFIPRFLYPAKETYHIGGWFRQLYEPDVINGWPVTTPGSWYVNFGWIGIFLGGWLSGLLLRAYDEAFNRVKIDPWHASIGAILPFFVFEAGITTGLPQAYVKWIIPLFAASIWINMLTNRYRTPPQRMQYGSPPALGYAAKLRS